MIKELDAKSFADLIKKRSVSLIDVREPFEHASAHISGSKLVPLGKISCDKLPENKKSVALYCKLGKRSLAAAEKLLSENKDLELYSLSGGIVSWQAAGLPTKSQNNALPIERQTQICIGLIVLIGCTLGHFVNYNFYALSAFMGCGLIFAGVSGFCGLAKLLGQLPWNKAK